MKYLIALCLGVFISLPVFVQSYGASTCHNEGMHCYRIQKGDTWDSLFPNEEERGIVQKVNRTNGYLKRNSLIAVPNDLGSISLLDVSPFAHSVSPRGGEFIMVNQSKLAWGAYTADGRLVNWGPISAGKDYCPDIRRSCNTATGQFTVYRKEGAGCFSRKFPVGKGGAKMPYCMFFHGGFALHGSNDVPGYNASHGCVRLFVEDAEWLNHNFVDVNETRVIVTH